MSQVRFTRSNATYGAFSNFSPYPIIMQGVEWPTVEHYYQAMKFVNSEYAELIRQASSPAEARRMGRDPLHAIRPDWNEIKEDVMLEALEAKFAQHLALGNLLTSTGQADLVEDSPHDAYWGCGSDGSGRNRMGVLLMRVRKRLSQQRDFKEACDEC